MERRILRIEEAVLKRNDQLAQRNREEFQARGIFVLNIVSSPGSGKTMLLERTLEALAGEMRIGVIVGDLETDNDAARMRGKGASVLQVTTDGYCHLEANMVEAAAREIGLEGLELLIIENVGNLVCPSSHDLGEEARVVLLSTPEGEDKPLKYPTLFKSSHVAVLTKMDLAEAVGFDRDAALANIRAVAPQLRVLETAARRGEGLDAWLDYLREGVRAARGRAGNLATP